MGRLYLQVHEPVAKRQHTAEDVNIPDGVLEQVLLHLPVKSLLRFKSVCKAWRDTITSQRFERCQLQLSRSRCPSMLILPLQLTTEDMRMGKIMFFSYPGHGTTAELVHEKVWSSGISGFKQPLHCDGLIVVAAAHCSQIFVCNPATKEFVALPAGTPDYSYGSQKVGFGVDTSTGKYKVVRCFVRSCDENMANYNIGCEIFTLGSRAWEPVEDPPYMVKSMAPVCLPGAIYWSAGITKSTQSMLRFDLHNEKFTVFPTPPCMKLKDRCSSLTDLAGKLCYTHILGNTAQLWMTEDDGVRLPKWLLHYTIVFPCLTWNMAPFSAHEGGIYFCVNLAHIYRYNIESGGLELVVNLNHGGLDWFHCAVQYSETLVSIRGHCIVPKEVTGCHSDGWGEYQ